MPLNYSKWDTLEVSDDSDIEGHPNVDHKSLVRWKQRDIHEKRQQRNMHIARLEAEIDCNTVLRARLVDIVKDVRAKGHMYFSQLAERFKTQPAPEKPPQSPEDAPTYDDMLYQLLMRVRSDLKSEGMADDDPHIDDKLADALQGHVVGLGEDIEAKTKEMEEEEREKKKKITSEDIKEGWESKYEPAKPAPEPLVKPKAKKKTKETTTEFETLNPSSSSTPPEPTPESEDDETPELTPHLRLFSQIKLSSTDPTSTFQKSFEFVQAHPDIYVDGAVDALLLEAFSSQMKGAKGDKEAARYALQCVHQGLLLQYCEKLGKDGVRMFFRKMIQGDPRAISVFQEDVKKTYEHIVTRASFHLSNEKNTPEKETIQLVVEGGDGASITFNVPEGPPPADLRLEGPGTEGLDVEEVRAALQTRWDLFCAFEPAMQAALKMEKLDEVNKVLGGMEVSEAEGVVGMMQDGGMLLFSESGVRDVTGAEAGGD